MPSPYPIRTVQAWWTLGLRAPLVVGRNYSLIKYIFFPTLDRSPGFFTFQTTTSRFVLDNLYSCNRTNNPLDHSQSFNSTWSYENRVSKHFVIFRNFPCLIAWHMFTVLFAYVVFFFFLLVLWLGICVEVDVDIITILPLHPLSRFVFHTHNSFFNTSDSYLKPARA